MVREYRYIVSMP